MKVKVVHICASAISVKFLLGDQIRYLESRGYEVHAVSVPDHYIDEVRKLGIRWHPAHITRSISPVDDLRGIFDVWRLCRREKFTIVHTHTPKATLVGVLGARLAHAPIVMETLHGFYDLALEPGPMRWLIKHIEYNLCRLCDHVLSQNPEDIERATREGVCDASHMTFLGNGIDIERFTPRHWSAEEIARRRQAVGLDPEGPVIGMVGRFVEGKGYRELAEAVKLLSPRYPGLRVLAIGTRPDMERSHEIFRPEQDPEVGDRFVCLYDRDDMEELYPLMDVFTLPSHREGFPRAPMEASAVQVPSVVTNVRGCRQVVDDAQTGLIVEVKNSRALASGLDELLANPDLRATMGRRARDKAEAEFDQRIVFARVADTYDHLLTRAGLAPASS